MIKEKTSFFLLTLGIFIALLLIVFGFVFGIFGLFGINMDPGIVAIIALVLMFVLCIFLIAQEEIKTIFVSIAGFVIILIIMNAITHDIVMSFIVSIILALIILVYTMSRFTGA